MKEDILALSWKQPFGSLMLHDKIETRTWKTNYRGWVLICVSKKSYNVNQLQNICGDYQHHRIVDTLGYETSQFDDLCGQAIAIGKLVDCRKMTKSDEDNCFVQYNPSSIVTIRIVNNKLIEDGEPLWCHIYEEVQEIKPFPFKGSQRWSKIDDTTFNKIQHITQQDLKNMLLL